MGRYRVELDLGHSPWLSLYYGYHWAAIGNLGVDLLVDAAGPADRPRARGEADRAGDPAADGRRFPVGRARSARANSADRLFRDALRLRPSRSCSASSISRCRWRSRSSPSGCGCGSAGSTGHGCARSLFVPISLIVFFCHTYGWGALGLLCFSAEAVRQHDRGDRLVPGGRRGRAARLGDGAADRHHAGLAQRDARRHHLRLVRLEAEMALWLISALRDRWQVVRHRVAGRGRWLVLVEALRQPQADASRATSPSRRSSWSAGFVLLPRIVFGSAYADMRLVPYMMAVLLLAIRFRGETDRTDRHRACGRSGCCSASFGLPRTTAQPGDGRRTTSRPSSPRSIMCRKGARVAIAGRIALRESVAAAAQQPSGRDGDRSPRRIFQRPMADGGPQPARAQISRRPGYFAADPSQLVRPNGCRDGLHLTIDRSAGLAAARRVRLCLADRHAAVRPRAGRRNAAGLARTRVYPLSIASMKLSIVVPCFNEEACLPALHERLAAAARDAVGEDYEIVLVNDGSRDSQLGDHAGDHPHRQPRRSRSTCRATTATSSR